MPGRARGRAKARRKERARRPGEPAPELPSPQAPGRPPPQGLAQPLPQAPDQSSAQVQEPTVPPAQQNVPVEEMEALRLGAVGGGQTVTQSQGPGMMMDPRLEPHGGARPKTKQQQQGRGLEEQKGKRDRGHDVPRGRGYSPGDQGHQRAGLVRGTEGGAEPQEDVIYHHQQGEQIGRVTGSSVAEGPPQLVGSGDVAHQRRERQEQERRRPEDDILTRPLYLVSKQGQSGRPVTLKTNYFSLGFPQNLVLYQYHVDYNPPCESRRVKMALLFIHENLIGRVHAFDGAMLFIPRRLQNEVTEVYSTRQSDNAQIRLTIKLTNELPPNDPQSIQVFNIIFRRMLRLLQMTQVQRHYFDFGSKITIPRHKLQVIPGVAAAIGPYETQVMLNVDIAHKLIRMDTVLDVMYEEYQRRQSTDDIVRRIVGSIVLTRYNNKTYRVDDIDFDMRATDTFQQSNGTNISYEDYFQQHYQERVTDKDQPLLVSRPSARDRNRGDTRSLYLVPEFCILTGLTDEMRADFQVMRDVAVHTRIPPTGRINRLQMFRNRFEENEQVRNELQNWQLGVSQNLVEIQGRILQKENIVQHGNVQLNYGQNAEWSADMRGKKLLVTVQMHHWIVVYPRRCAENARDLVQSLMRVGGPMGMNFAEPAMVQMNDDRNDTYVRALSDNVNRDVQMVVCITPNQKKDRYDAIKKFCVCERPVPSQVVVQRTLNKKQMLMSVATKIAIQLNCKLGGEIWALEIPFSTPFMVMGIDVFHDSSSKNRSVAGVVCSLNRNCTRFYSRVTFQTSHVEMVDQLTAVCTAALRKFHEVNNRLPERIFVYRDGVGDGQLEAVFKHELQQVKRSFRLADQPDYRPKVIFTVVKKRINTRFFKCLPQTGEAENPPPGTVVDSVVTKGNWFDFFLISQSVRQGTVSPTHYNVIKDEAELGAERMQRWTYKMTHLYYNWPGTIRVPAPCQYAHKLAFLVGQSLHREPSLHLSDKLFYL